MAGVGLYLERREDDVIFPSREGGGGVARAARRYVTQDESAQRVTDRCQACNLYVCRYHRCHSLPRSSFL